jgi:putative protease
VLSLKDEDGIRIDYICDAAKEPAKQTDKALENIRSQLLKLGNTCFEAGRVDMNLPQAYFIPNSLLTEWRRQAFDCLEEERKAAYKREERKIEQTSHPFPQKELSYLGNVHNRLAENFYRQHGVEQIEPSFEKKAQAGVPLMFTRHCLKYSLGACKRFKSDSSLQITDYTEPLFLKTGNNLLELEFDCANCQMLVKKNLY